MKYLIAIFLIAITSIGHANSCSYTSKSFSNWIMEYFRSPNASIEELSCSLKYYSNSSMFEEYPDSRMLTAYFFMNVYPESEYLYLFNKLNNQSSLNEKMFLLHVLWAKNSENSRNLLAKTAIDWDEPVIQEMVPKMLDSPPRDILIVQPESAAELDNLWAVFFATGNEEPIRQIASVLHLFEEGHGMKIAVAGAAKWSLTSNATHYPEIKAIIQKLEKIASGEQKTVLKDILEKSTHNNSKKNASEEGWLAKDGSRVKETDNMKSVKGFGGSLLVTPDEDWEEKWNTPSHTTPYFREASTVKYGQKLSILTFFTNPMLDQIGNIHLSCGIKVTRPDGTTSFDQKNIECLKGPFHSDPHSVFLSPVVIHYSGDEGDPAGEWNVEIYITDENRDATVHLKSSFTLVE
ncbi:MAG: hypothetical protein GQ548_00550 [Methylophaga sp.]|nr:hypothetical protein [Methylophaga sp.]